MRDTERGAETQEEREAGSPLGVWFRTRSQDPRITPWAEGRRSTAEPPRYPNILKSLSNMWQHKDYSTIPELSATLITWQQNPSFPANLCFPHIVFVTESPRKNDSPPQTLPHFSDGKTIPGREVTYPRSGTLWEYEECREKLPLPLLGPGTNYQHPPKNRSWISLAQRPI